MYWNTFVVIAITLIFMSDHFIVITVVTLSPLQLRQNITSLPFLPCRQTRLYNCFGVNRDFPSLHAYECMKPGPPSSTTTRWVGLTNFWKTGGGGTTGGGSFSRCGGTASWNGGGRSLDSLCRLVPFCPPSAFSPHIEMGAGPCRYMSLNTQLGVGLCCLSN